MRAVVDTNVWVRAFLNAAGSAGRVATALLEGSFTLVTSEPLLEELADVLTRPRVRRKHGRDDALIAAFVTALREGGELVLPAGTVQVCRDPDDNVLIETAQLGETDVLVSEDQDLHAIEVREHLAAAKIRVLTVAAFLAVVESSVPTEDPEQ
jgi:putative PIN family toxin of toxin-antitoxin system